MEHSKNSQNLESSISSRIIKRILNRSNHFVKIINTGIVFLDSFLLFLLLGIIYIGRFIIVGEEYPEIQIVFMIFLAIIILLTIIFITYGLYILFRKKEVKILIFYAKHEISYPSHRTEMKFTVLNIFIMVLTVIIGILILILFFSNCIFFVFYGSNGSF